MPASFIAVIDQSLKLDFSRRMSIQNELSSDIAVALLAGKDRDPQRLDDLKKVVLKVHSILQEASKNVSARRVRAVDAGEDKTKRRPE